MPGPSGFLSETKAGSTSGKTSKVRRTKIRGEHKSCELEKGTNTCKHLPTKRARKIAAQKTRKARAERVIKHG